MMALRASLDIIYLESFNVTKHFVPNVISPLSGRADGFTQQYFRFDDWKCPRTSDMDSFLSAVALSLTLSIRTILIYWMRGKQKAIAKNMTGHSTSEIVNRSSERHHAIVLYLVYSKMNSSHI